MRSVICISNYNPKKIRNEKVMIDFQYVKHLQMTNIHLKGWPDL